MENRNFVCSWSGGKDSCFALYKAIAAGCKPKVALTVFNENGLKTRSHGIHEDIIDMQLKSLRIPSEKINSTWNDYEFKFVDKLNLIRNKYEVNTAVFGDIDLQPHLEWEEMVCRKSDLKAFLPLWNMNRKVILNEFLEAGFKTMIVAVNSEKLSTDYLGKVIDNEVIQNLEKDGADVCGENGEYHTVVVDGPFFSFPIELNKGEIYSHSGYSFVDTFIFASK